LIISVFYGQVVCLAVCRFITDLVTGCRTYTVLSCYTNNNFQRLSAVNVETE